MRQRSETAEDLLATAHAIQAPAVDNLVTDSVSLRTIEEHENDSGTETLHDTDSEPEDQHSKQEELIKECTGLNVSRKLKRKRKIVAKRERNEIRRVERCFDFCDLRIIHAVTRTPRAHKINNHYNIFSHDEDLEK